MYIIDDYDRECRDVVEARGEMVGQEEKTMKRGQYDE